MGTIGASSYALWPGRVTDAAEAVGRAYAKFELGAAAEGTGEVGKQVILLTRAGEGVAWRAC
jgi:hypothetical protein